MKINYNSLVVNIGVDNVYDTVKFYEKVLGFKMVMQVPESGDLVWAMMSNGDVSIMFQEKNSLKEEYSLIDYGSVGLTFYIKVSNVNALYEKLKDSDLIVKQLHKTFYEMNEFAIKDINGYVLTISGSN